MPEFELQAGEYHGNVYFVHVRAEPSYHSPDDFSVTLYYNEPETKSNVQVARIDNSHGYVHIDRLYRRDEDREALDLDFWEAVEHIERRWRTYARSHERD